MDSTPNAAVVLLADRLIAAEAATAKAEIRRLSEALAEAKADLAHYEKALNILADELSWSDGGRFLPEFVCERPPKQADGDAAA